jgi:deoxyhypusine monooxygenase
VRHEAAEALANIGGDAALKAIRAHLEDPAQEVAETCQIALDKLNYLAETGITDETNSQFLSVDPAPAAKEKDVKALRIKLTDPSLTLFERYRAMFALRNLCTAEAVEALAAGFQE